MRKIDVYGFFTLKKYFSVGMKEDSGDYYVSIPASNRKVDYEEYYRMDKSLFEQYQSDLSQLDIVAEECRKRLRDRDLIIKLGSDRGAPV